MRARSPLSEHFDVMREPGIAARLQDLDHALDSLDNYLDGLPKLETAPPVASQIASGSYRVDEGMSVVIDSSGKVEDACVTPPYDIMRHPTDPTLIMASRIMAFTITPRPNSGLAALFRGPQRGLKRPPSRFYLFGLQVDHLEHHTSLDSIEPDLAASEKAAEATPPKIDSDSGEATTALDASNDDDMLTLNSERLKRVPASQAFKFGIARRSGEICLFAITRNERYGSIIPIMAGSGSIFSSDSERAELGPLDNKYWRLQASANDQEGGRLIIDVISDINTLLEETPQATIARGWIKRLIKRGANT